MSGCNINGNHTIGVNEVDGKMSLVANKILGNHTIIGVNEIDGEMSLWTNQVLGNYSIPKPDYLSNVRMCIPAVEKVIAVWYVYGETVVGVDDKYYGYVMFK